MYRWIASFVNGVLEVEQPKNDWKRPRRKQRDVYRPALQRLEIRELLTLAFDPPFRFSISPEIEQDGHVFVGTDQSEASALAIQANDDVFLAGITTVGTIRKWQVVKLQGGNGDPDTTFSGDGVFLEDFFGSGQDTAEDMVLDLQGRIVVAGWVDPPGGTTDPEFGVMRIKTDGTFDLDFSGDGKQNFGFPGQTLSKAFAVDVDPSGRIVVAGIVLIGSTTSCAIARLTAAGAMDNSFGMNGLLTFPSGNSCVVRAVDAYVDETLQEHRILLGGHVAQVAMGPLDFGAFRLCENGQFENGTNCGPGFGVNGQRVIDISGNGGHDVAFSLVRHSDDGKIVLAGDTDGGLGASEVLIARFKPNADGTNQGLDTSFGNGDDVNNDGIVKRKFQGTFNITRARAVARTVDGRYAVAGFATNQAFLPGNSRFYVGLYNTDGRILNQNEILSQFTNPSDHSDQAHGVGVDSQGRIVAGGFHTHSGIQGFGPGGGIPINSGRFAAIRLLIQFPIPPAPPGGGKGSATLGQVSLSANGITPVGRPMTYNASSDTVALDDEQLQSDLLFGEHGTEQGPMRVNNAMAKESPFEATTSTYFVSAETEELLVALFTMPD